MLPLQPVCVLQALRDKLKGKASSALLVGYPTDAGLVLLDLLELPAAGSSTQEALDTLPQPLCVLGAYGPSLAEAHSAAAQQRHGDQAPQVVVYPVDGSMHAAAAHGGAAVELRVLDQDLQSWLQTSHCMCRCRTAVRLDVVIASQASSDALEKALSVAVQQAASQLHAPDPVFAMSAPDGVRVLLTPSTPSSVLEALLRTAPAGAPLQVDVLVDSSSAAAGQAGPVFEFRPLADSASPASCQPISLELDALCYVPRGAGAGAPAARQLCELFGCALEGQLRAVARVMQAQGKILKVRVHHFLPPGRAHHVSALYPQLAQDSDLNEAKLQATRQRLHALLGLPLDRPLLRLANALELAAGGGADAPTAPSRLVDVHLGLTPPGIGGVVELVRGSYEYCHYMQDRFNDAGWGCAYRSLQTICSWFRLQKYTRKPIPGHREIQEVLVRLGDKDPSFAGSSNWIGAIELGYVLDEYLGVTCKVVTVNRGADIPSHARQLAAHFASVGTPVMIGGGVLAYTLLGVAFNEQTGEAAFLILDPHYTGGEDLRKIQQGTWVGWKQLGDTAAAGGPLFVPDAFYNFLCPQRPNTV